MDQRAFEFLPLNARAAKPRTRGITEIRGSLIERSGPRARMRAARARSPLSPRERAELRAHPAAGGCRGIHGIRAIRDTDR